MEPVRRARNGDWLCAERLMERHRQAVLRTAYRALGNPDDAQDVAQEALVHTFQHLAEVRDGSRLSAYLRQVTLTLCADYRRRRGTRRLGEPIALLDAAGEEADYAQGLAVRQALARLSDAQRTALLLRYVGGWSLGEIADLTHTPQNTVRSRLLSGKRLLRDDLQTTFFFDTPNQRKQGNRMPAQSSTAALSSAASPALSETHHNVLQAVYPGARVLSVQQTPEAWLPFNPRVHLSLTDGTETTVDFRGDIADRQRAELVAALGRAGVGALCELPRGENLTLWALGGTPHRIRLASERAFDGIDLLQNATDHLMAEPVGETLSRRTLTDEVGFLVSDDRWNADAWMAEEGRFRRDWLEDPWFAATLRAVRAAVADIHTPLVYTDYTHFFGQGYRIEPGGDVLGEASGWSANGANLLAEVVYLFGHFGDPLLGLSMERTTNLRWH